MGLFSAVCEEGAGLCRMQQRLFGFCPVKKVVHELISGDLMELRGVGVGSYDLAYPVYRVTGARWYHLPSVLLLPC